MHKRFIPVLGAVLVCAVSTMTSTAACGAAFPTHGLEIIVGFEPGSGSDTTVRAFMPFVGKALGQTVTIRNLPGAGGALGWNATAKAKPDGYTLGYAPMPSVMNGAVLAKVEYDPLNSFAWLGMIAYDPVALTVKADGAYKTLNDFVAAAKAAPGKVTIGATGRGSIDHTIGLGIEKSKGVKFTIVNFDGTPQGITAVMGGNVSAMGMTATISLPYEKAGQLRAIGVGGDKPFPGLPNAQTFKSQGVELFTEGVYRGFMVPKAVPADVYATLVKAIKTASDDPQWKAQAEKMVLPLLYMTPEEAGVLAQKHNTAAKQYLAK